MPTTLYDDDVSGDGVASWGFGGIIYVSVDITSWGVESRILDVSDHRLRTGWIALGDSFDIGLGTFEYWDEPKYCNWQHNRFLPDPGGSTAGAYFLYFASRIRWHFSSGAMAHIHVLGA